MNFVPVLLLLVLNRLLASGADFDFKGVFRRTGGVYLTQIVTLSFRNPDEQSSGNIQLKGNRLYYIEGISVKHGNGDDHFSVGVSFPSGRLVRPLTSNFVQQTRNCK